MTRFINALALLSFVVAVGCALTGLGAGLGARFGFWHFGVGIGTIAKVFWVAAGTAAFCTVVVLLAVAVARTPRAAVVALAALVIASATAWVPYDLRTTAQALPPIHDITTDLVDPPAFVRVATLRGPGDHPVAYDGPGVAAQQREAYPDLAPLVLKLPRAQVVAAAQAALESMGLDLVDVDAEGGRIEATATSLLFGFKDDVVVRITDNAGSTQVDARSKSRVGRHDLGMNAKRVRAFLTELGAALD